MKKKRAPRRDKNDDSEESSDLGGPQSNNGSDNDLRAEVDLNAISGSAGIFKAESIQEGNLQL